MHFILWPAVAVYLIIFCGIYVNNLQSVPLGGINLPLLCISQVISKGIWPSFLFIEASVQKMQSFCAL